MSIQVITAPAAEPLTLAEAKHHLRLLGNDDDVYVASLIKAARQYVELETSRVLVTQTLRQTMDAFPTAGVLVLLRAPVQAVLAVDYVDGNGVTQAWATDQYRAITSAEPAMVRPARTGRWPGVHADGDAVSVTYTAGFGPPAAVPELAKAAIRLLMANWYENREAVVVGTISNELPRGVGDILGMLKWGLYL